MLFRSPLATGSKLSGRLQLTQAAQPVPLLVPGPSAKLSPALAPTAPSGSTDHPLFIFYPLNNPQIFFFLMAATGWGFFVLFIYLFIFIFSCVGSSFLCEGFLQLRQAGATLHRGARASHYRGLACCGAQAPDAQAQ